jgi:hypothetical protein
MAEGARLKPLPKREKSLERADPAVPRQRTRLKAMHA